ncbi:MAG: 50S ribosomal protein L6 [Candidatus Pacebacteria bacterium]|nr:50S ribosomal protein L6 [Candidatus Paceibacterota bacterium]
MSRVGKKPIQIPQGVEVRVERQKTFVKGPKGELSREFRPEVKIETKENEIVFSIDENTKLSRSLWGLSRMLLFNMIKGVVEGFEKKLEIQGVGYKAEVSGDSLVLNVGFSHSVKMEIPKDIKVSLDKNIITVSGFDKEAVGQFAANIRRVKPPEPYKGKGIRYLGEKVRRKVGKKVAGATTPGK